MEIVLPIVHMNGTSRDALIDLRAAAGLKIVEALEALSAMAPHGRDYYPQPGLFDRAREQHERRAATLRGLRDELVAEVDGLWEGA